jgi:hypothetical protein
MKCCICEGEIEKQYHPETGQMYWDQGHNAEPVVARGRCCGNCNSGVVIPARLKGWDFGPMKEKTDD